MRTGWNWKIDSLAKLLVMIAGVGYLLSFLGAIIPIFHALLSLCALSPEMILRGQIWRLVTWVLIPPSGFDSLFDILWILLTLYCRYWIGLMVENTLGRKYFGLYIGIGVILTDVFAFLAIPLGWFTIPGLYTMYYLNIAVFLVLAIAYPDRQVFFMFAIPMKMLWLGIIDVAFIAFDVVRYLRLGLPQILLVVLPALITFGLLMFFPETRGGRKVASSKRQRQFNRSVKMTPPYGSSMHRCRICGRTPDTNPELEFRFCSKCLGNYEYCSEHLFTHEHVKG